ncbi:MAG TPA: zinc ribbon domain-containing protein [Planctomycetaceae bacterium]|nr:zinc ribbon domain-containing protein [Planctomycetaceae bacterium]
MTKEIWGRSSMPLYEYHCPGCDQTLELLVRTTEPAKCSKCGGEQLIRLLSVVAAPTRSSAGPCEIEPPRGSCGTGCGCFPDS